VRAPLVVTVGDLVLDVTCRLRGDLRHGTDTAAQVVIDAGGQAANAAAWAVQAGARARLVARRSSDHAGRLAEERISLRGVDVVGPVGAAGGGAIVVLVRAGGERDMLSDRGAAASLAPHDVPDGLLDEARALLVTGYALGSEPMLGAGRRAAALAHAAGVPVVVELSSEALIEAVGAERFARRVASLEAHIVLGTSAEHALLGGVSATLQLAPTVIEKVGRPRRPAPPT
jgi:sugar/nucleoside kinase (ribokinase family)